MLPSVAVRGKSYALLYLFGLCCFQTWFSHCPGLWLPGFLIAGEFHFSSQEIQWGETRGSVPNSPLPLAGHGNWGPAHPSFLCLGRILLDTHGPVHHGSTFSYCLSDPQSEQGTRHSLPELFTYWVFSHLKSPCLLTRFKLANPSTVCSFRQPGSLTPLANRSFYWQGLNPFRILALFTMEDLAV